jgi:hypothetical protein
MDHRPDAARLEPWQDDMPQLVGDRRLFRDAARTQHRSGQCQALAHHRIEVQLGLVTLEECDLSQSSARA